MSLLLDTGVIRDLCRREDHENKVRFQKVLARGEQIFLSVVAPYELRRHFYRYNATAQIRLLDALTQRFGIKDISWPAWDRAATIWATLKKRNITLAPDQRLDGDGLLSAHAEISSATIATKNVRHFEEIGAAVEDWSI
ncbi:MAG: PIN domain-containing protein [Candidatus Tectomicrobia bacterium]|nr:PIN domain-containing protein [Candidatus Tectomicrobia bacterium]